MSLKITIIKHNLKIQWELIFFNVAMSWGVVREWDLAFVLSWFVRFDRFIRCSLYSGTASDDARWVGTLSFLNGKDKL